MHPQFKRLVKVARSLDVTVIDRCNLTILMEPDYIDMAEFLADQSVEIVASLPCYSATNVDKQRGKGVFEYSIDALKQLNRLGYGHHNSNLILNLVYNPLGATLPPDQKNLSNSIKKNYLISLVLSLINYLRLPICLFSDSEPSCSQKMNFHPI
ncbi:hypothetical protein MY149_00210 [Acinetobacter indicus]|nr:hypothetical protein [Acinetobacter indicus]